MNPDQHTDLSPHDAREIAKLAAWMDGVAERAAALEQHGTAARFRAAKAALTDTPTVPATSACPPEIQLELWERGHGLVAIAARRWAQGELEACTRLYGAAHALTAGLDPILQNPGLMP
jgi:hypothetical protein